MDFYNSAKNVKQQTLYSVSVIARSNTVTELQCLHALISLIDASCLWIMAQVIHKVTGLKCGIPQVCGLIEINVEAALLMEG